MRLYYSEAVAYPIGTKFWTCSIYRASGGKSLQITRDIPPQEMTLTLAPNNVSIVLEGIKHKYYNNYNIGWIFDNESECIQQYNECVDQIIDHYDKCVQDILKKRQKLELRKVIRRYE